MSRRTLRMETLEARAVFDDIRATRKTDFVNNAWRAQANDPVALARTWEKAKAVMAPGALDAVTKEMIYLTVSIMNNCEYCIHSHAAASTALDAGAPSWHTSNGPSPG